MAVRVVGWLSTRDQVGLGLLPGLAATATLLPRHYGTALAATRPLTATAA
ncbi:hypothetical protein ACGFY9_24495 [Streptomyces sp. NPDC048504]